MARDYKVAALLYHHVGPLRDESCRSLNVSETAFTKQIKTLRALGFETISPDQWVGYVRGGDIPGRRHVMITFDDAYADLTEFAFPILEQSQFTATVFVPTSIIGRSLPCNPRSPDASLPLMAKDDITNWAARGISFGAHSRTHADLTALSHDAVEAEVRGSKEELAAITGKPVTSFAYPYGRLSTPVKSIAGAAFDSCFTLVEGMNDARTELSSLRRTMVQHGDTVADVCLRATYGMSVLERVRTVVGSMRSS
jgi:peptidoglycan/xylan/chitin deacetylase (PgdA/CDA1 family)